MEIDNYWGSETYGLHCLKLKIGLFIRSTLFQKAIVIITSCYLYYIVMFYSRLKGQVRLRISNSYLI